MKSRVFDARKGGWFWIPNNLIDLYGNELGPYALTVYVVMCRMADINGECYPSIDVVADKCGMSKASVQRSIKKLANHTPPLLGITHRMDGKGQLANQYRILEILPEQTIIGNAS